MSMTYQELRRQVQAAGLLNRSGWLSLPVALATVTLGVAVLAILVAAPGAWRFAAIPFLTLFWMQLGFFGHDAGHNQIFPRTEHNRRLGLFCYPFMLGLTFRPWVIKHNLHHVETNVIDSDPDLINPIIALTLQDAQERRGFLRWIVRYQAYAYPILALFATLAFRVDAWRYAIVGTIVQGNAEKYAGERKFELVLLSVNAVLWLVLPSILLGPLLWLAIFGVAQMLLGFHMAFVFAPNHKGMPMIEDATDIPFLDHQVLTSRNVAGSLVTDFMYGGLNYQVEHHLFPTMPRSNFPACREFVLRCCAESGLAYTEESFLQSCKTLFDSLNDIGRELELVPVTA